MTESSNSSSVFPIEKAAPTGDNVVQSHPNANLWNIYAVSRRQNDMKKNKKDKKYKVISLFAGCGGTDLGYRGGFKSLGKNYPENDFEIIWANDHDKPACITYEKNFNHAISCADINKVLDGSNKTLFPVDIMPERADIVLGGFPCQDFSLAGKRRGFGSKRGTLYRAMVEVVRRTRPAVFMAENVKGLLSMNGGDAIRTIEKDFGDLGYHISTKLYHTANYGIPQSRERVVIVGTDKKRKLPKFEHPESTHSKDEWVTLGEAIGDLEKVKEGDAPNHFWSQAKMFPGTQGNSIISKDKIGPTMRSEHHGNIEWHWNKKRRLSAREAARIQSFPDDFIFYPSTSGAYKQIGNAIAPVMAWHVAKAIEKFLDKHLTKS